MSISGASDTSFTFVASAAGIYMIADLYQSQISLEKDAFWDLQKSATTYHSIPFFRSQYTPSNDRDTWSSSLHTRCLDACWKCYTGSKRFRTPHTCKNSQSCASSSGCHFNLIRLRRYWQGLSRHSGRCVWWRRWLCSSIRLKQRCRKEPLCSGTRRGRCRPTRTTRTACTTYTAGKTHKTWKACRCPSFIRFSRTYWFGYAIPRQEWPATTCYNNKFTASNRGRRCRHEPSHHSQISRYQ